MTAIAALVRALEAERWVPDDWLDRIFAVITLAHWHTFLPLTKRSARMRAYLQARSALDEQGFAAEDIRVAMTALAATPSRRRAAPALQAIPLRQYCRQVPWPLPQVWLGVSTEDQQRADERVPDLLATPAAVRWVSAEPLLGSIDFTHLPDPDTGSADPWPHYVNALTGDVSDDANGIVDGVYEPGQAPRLDQIIVGCESGRGRRPCDLADVRVIRDQCAAAGVAFFLKQLIVDGRKVGLPELDGRTWAEMPAVVANPSYTEVHP